MRIFNFTENVFHANVILLVGGKDEVNKYVYKKYKVVDWIDNDMFDGQHGYLVHSDGFEYSVIWFDTFDWVINDMSKLVHEVSHLIDNIFETRGVTEIDGELRAYYMGWWSKAMFTVLAKEYNNRAKRKKK